MATADGDTYDYGDPLPGPICGCCRKPVEIVRSKGTPYSLRGTMHTPVVETVVWKCECPALRARVQCFLCNRCPNCCRCSAPALEAK